MVKDDSLSSGKLAAPLSLAKSASFLRITPLTRLASRLRRLVGLLLGWLACAPLAMAAAPPLPEELLGALQASRALTALNLVVDNVGSFPEAVRLHRWLLGPAAACGSGLQPFVTRTRAGSRVCLRPAVVCASVLQPCVPWARSRV